MVENKDDSRALEFTMLLNGQFKHTEKCEMFSNLLCWDN